MVNKKSICIFLVLVFVISSAHFYCTKANEGWESQNGKVYYINSEGQKLIGWNEIDGDKFYMFEDGSVATKWTEIDGNKYYFRSKDTSEHKTGSMLTGKRTLGGVVYYFGDDGALLEDPPETIESEINNDIAEVPKIEEGWINENGKVCYINSDGVKVTGWNIIDGDKFYMFEDGAVATKWTEIDGNKYYFRSKDTSEHKTGSMLTGHRTLSGVEYVFDDNGILQGSISATISPKNVSNKDGYTQTITFNNKTYKLFKQGQGSWATKNYYSCSNDASSVAKYTYKNTGCGPTALATIISGFNSSATPLTIGKKCLKNSIPSSLPSLKTVATQSGFKCKISYYSPDYEKTYEEIKNALIAGHKVLLYVGKAAPESYWGNFTTSGYHYISILAIDECNEKVFVGNSSGSRNSGWFDLSTAVNARGNSNSNNKMNGWMELYK